MYNHVQKIVLKLLPQKCKYKPLVNAIDQPLVIK